MGNDGEGDKAIASLNGRNMYGVGFAIRRDELCGCFQRLFRRGPGRFSLGLASLTFSALVQLVADADAGQTWPCSGRT